MAEEKTGAAGPLQESVGGSLSNIEERLLDMALDADVKSVLTLLSSIQSQCASNGSGISEIKSTLSSIQSSISSLQSAVANIQTGGGTATDLTPVLTALEAVKADTAEILTDLEGNPAPPAPSPTP